ncbi:MAG TPA: hypothetical protein VF461_24720 [Gemmatimonadaceae bacterium]
MTRSILVLGLAGVCLLACDDSSATSPRDPSTSRSGVGPTARSASTPLAATSDSKIVSFETMYGVDEGFVKNKAIRGVEGDELPWEVGSAVGSLTVGGHLTVSVRGIVFSSDPEVPPELRGINDEDNFRALVSCLVSEKKNGKKISTVNVTTGPFPSTRSGDSDIDAQLQLPADCVAPIIFILSGSEDKWFAVTGAETS